MTGERIRAGKPPPCFNQASHPGQFSLLPSAGREMSTRQNAVTLCGSAVKAGMAHCVDKRVSVS